MKEYSATRAMMVGVVLLLFGGGIASVDSQGLLTPPGAPAPTMKTLDQVEARIAIDPRDPGFSLPRTISSPGSYYLAANITASGSTAAIIIAADNVTLDLNGFALVGGGSGAVAGINVPAAQKNLCVRNGVISGWTNGGLRADNASGSLYEKLRLSGNSGGDGSAGLLAGPGSHIKGCVASGQTGIPGIRTADHCTVADCTSSTNGSGFYLGSNCTITNSTASGNLGNGIQTQDASSVLHCTASGNNGPTDPNGAGILTGAGCAVADCTAGGNTSNGISVKIGCTVRHCTARLNNLHGIWATTGCQVIGNHCDNNDVPEAGSAGIHISGTSNRIEGNTCSFNGIGFDVGSAHNLIIHNSARGNSTNYQLASGNTYGAIIDRSGVSGSSVSGSSATSTLGTTDPWANFTY